MSYGEVLWKKVISKMSNPFILHCNCGTGVESVRAYAENGISKNRIIATDRLQKNLDALKSDGFITVKADLAQSSLAHRMPNKRFDAIVFTSEEKVWSPGLLLSAAELPDLLNEQGTIVLVVPKVESNKELTGTALDIYNSFARQFDKVRIKQAEDVEKTFFIFGAKK